MLYFVVFFSVYFFEKTISFVFFVVQLSQLDFADCIPMESINDTLKIIIFNMLIFMRSGMAIPPIIFQNSDANSIFFFHVNFKVNLANSMTNMYWIFIRIAFNF